MRRIHGHGALGDFRPSEEYLAGFELFFHPYSDRQGALDVPQVAGKGDRVGREISEIAKDNLVRAEKRQVAGKNVRLDPGTASPVYVSGHRRGRVLDIAGQISLGVIQKGQLDEKNLLHVNIGIRNPLNGNRIFSDRDFLSSNAGFQAPDG